MWKEILEEGSVDWNDISNKPIDFPPKTHTHSEYALSEFKYNLINYDLHDVVSQVVEFLEKNHGFKLK